MLSNEKIAAKPIIIRGMLRIAYRRVFRYSSSIYDYGGCICHPSRVRFLPDAQPELCLQSIRSFHQRTEYLHPVSYLVV
jgi:hypothetical protein